MRANESASFGLMVCFFVSNSDRLIKWIGEWLDVWLDGWLVCWLFGRLQCLMIIVIQKIVNWPESLI